MYMGQKQRDGGKPTRRVVCMVLAVMAAVSCVCSSAFALEPGTALGEPPLGIDTGVVVNMDVQVVGRSGNRYDSGDMLVLTASVENRTEFPVSGDLWMTYPDSGCVVVAEPVLESRKDAKDRVYAVDDLQPGVCVDAVLVLRAPDESDITDWLATATFAIKNGGGCMAKTAEAHFGKPDVKLSREALVRDGVLDITNTGTGAASSLKFRFLAKKGWQKQDGLPDGAYYIGEGRIEIELGAIAAKGHIERDVSGLLHERMNMDGDFELIYDAGEVLQAAIE